MSPFPNPSTDRRGFLKLAAAGAATAASVPALGACSSGLQGASSTASDVLKIGLVSPQTGALASFASSDAFVVKTVQEALRNGFTAGGKKRKIEIVVKDTQSSSTRATEVTQQLITQDNCNLIVASGTPDTTNPVADLCEASGVPNVTTIVPWEAWFHGRNGTSGTGFKYTTMFFFGMQQFADAFFPMWQRIGVSSKDVACLWPDDSDANAFRSGLGAMMSKAGYTPIDGGKYQNGTTEFASQLSKFKSSGAELFTCTPIPPDFAAFWKQAAQQNFKPKLATVAKVMLFPAEAEALGQLSNNIATDIWWSPSHPNKSSLDGTTAKQLAESFAKDTGKQWTQALGSVYSLFEVAVEAFKKAADPTDKDAVAEQLRTLNYTGMSGALDFTKGPEPGIAIQHPVGGQWRPGKDFAWDITVVDNTPDTSVPVGGDLMPTNP